MWALRRASVSIRLRGLSSGTAQLCSATSELSNHCFEDCNFGVNGTAMLVPERSLLARRFYGNVHSRPTPFTGSCSFSSIADEKRSEEEDELVSESEPFGDDAEGMQEEPSFSDSEAREILEVVLSASPQSVGSAMDTWMEGGKKLTRPNITFVMRGLRKRRMYVKALKLSEWLDASELFSFIEKDYVSHCDLTAKVRGLKKAEAYVQNIPESFRNETVYRTLLANCVAAINVKKSEDVFNKMKDLELPLSCFTFNQMLLLYRKTDKKKISDVLVQMEKENVKPNMFTYRILIEAKGQYNDTNGMEQVVEQMKSGGIEPDYDIKCLMARIYTRYSHTEKAEALLKELEEDNTGEKGWIFTRLLTLYADLGKADEVSRIWELCGPNPRVEQCMGAIEAWGKLKRIDEAEAVFETMQKNYPSITSKRYSILLNVYADNKMLDKGESLVKLMSEKGCHIGVSTWTSLVKLYIEAGKVEKADSILSEASKRNGVKPLYHSYIAILEEYAKKGDVHNAEKIFNTMKSTGFTSLYWLYQTLVRAYVNAKAPAYGMTLRLMADKISPTNELAAMLPRVDPFRKTALSDLLD